MKIENEITDKEHQQRVHDYEMGVIEGKGKFKTIDFIRGLFIGFIIGYSLSLLA